MTHRTAVLGRSTYTALVFAASVITVAGSPRSASAMVGADEALSAATPPAVVALYEPGSPRGEQFCSGTLIAPRWVLTAAHCLELFTSPTQLVVAVPGSSRRYVVHRYYSHPKYDQQRFDLGYDIALVRLRTPVSGVPVIPYRGGQPKQKTGPGHFEAYGWGANDHTDSAQQPGGTRQVLWDAPVFGGLRYNPRRQIAAVAVRSVLVDVADVGLGVVEEQFEGICAGDSGGPLLERHPVDGRVTVVGVISYGDPDCYARSPGIFTRVSAHLRWMTQVLGHAGRTSP